MMTAKIFGFPIAFIALAALAFASPATAADEFEKYALESVSVELSSTQAGAHADLTTSFELSEKEGKPYAQTRDIEVQLPPGVIGNPQGIPRCTVEQLGTEPVDSACPMDSQVGISQVTVGGTADGTFTTPVYNMEPPGGDVVAALGVRPDRGGDDLVGRPCGPQPRPRTAHSRGRHQQRIAAPPQSGSARSAL